MPKASRLHCPVKRELELYDHTAVTAMSYFVHQAAISTSAGLSSIFLVPQKWKGMSRLGGDADTSKPDQTSISKQLWCESGMHDDCAVHCRYSLGPVEWRVPGRFGGRSRGTLPAPPQSGVDILAGSEVSAAGVWRPAKGTIVRGSWDIRSG